MKQTLITIIFTFSSIMILPAVADALARGYRNVAPGIQQGMVVRQGAASDGSAQIQPADRQNGSNVIGVTTDVPQDARTERDAAGVVFVESAGEVAALVSEQAGVIKAGDTLTLGDTPGVLVKLIDAQTGVSFATAVQDYDPARSQSLRINNQDITVASIMVTFGGPGAAKIDPDASGIKQFGDGIVNKDLSETRLVMAFFLLLSVMVVGSVILYGAISNGLYSVGRNPLSKRDILRSMFLVIVAGLAVIVSGLAGVYLIVR